MKQEAAVKAAPRSMDTDRVHVLARDGVQPGQSVKLMVRPECLTVLGGGERAENEIQAGLKDVIMVGGITKHYARLVDGKGRLIAHATETCMIFEARPPR